MKPLPHLLLSTIAAGLIWFIFDFGWFGVLLFWLGGWLIMDLDHFLYFSIKKNIILPNEIIGETFRDSKIRSKISRETLDDYKYPVLIFHCTEALLLILLVSYFYNVAYFLFAGFLFHFLVDYLDISSRGKNFMPRVSLIYLLVRNKNKKELEI